MSKPYFLRELDKQMDFARTRGNVDLFDALTEVLNFIGTGSFTDSPSFKQFFQYRDLSTRELADMMQIASSTVGVKKKTYSDRLYKLFGDDFFELAYSEDGVSTILSRLDAVNSEYRVNDLVIPQVMSSTIGVAYPEETQVKDCEYEVMVLRQYSPFALNLSMSLCSEENMAFLVDVLAGKAGTMRERILLTKAIKDAPAVMPTSERA